MGKQLFIAEKPSVAQEFARTLGVNGGRRDGYLESDQYIVTWCVGHLITMSYPDRYDPKYKRWSLDTLPFFPSEYLYEVIPSVKKQYDTVASLLNRDDVDTIYVCTDSGREGEYIYRLVEQMAHVTGKTRKRVWIDSQTEAEIKKGIREAKDLSAYDNLADAAYLRAQEDYLMGINFSRLLTLKYGTSVSSFLNRDRTVISVGRVMTCVLGMVVRREREIRDFVPTPFYRLTARFVLPEGTFTADWKAVEGSRFYGTPSLYRDFGFKEEAQAKQLAEQLMQTDPREAGIASVSKKTEKSAPKLLYNLAELQNDCARALKISPDETLKQVQELYEKKLVTYPRTDARVLSSAVAKEITRNLEGLTRHSAFCAPAKDILDRNLYNGLAKTRYVDDKKITDHYAIIPTGDGLSALDRLPSVTAKIYEMIVRRFLAIFYPPAVYQKIQLDLMIQNEHFILNGKQLKEEGWMFLFRKEEAEDKENKKDELTPALFSALEKQRKGAAVPFENIEVRSGETSPAKRYTSGTLILAMENAGSLIEDENLRAEISGSGIGTSATRAEILKKLVSIGYLSLAKKTQTVTPTMLGETVYEVVEASIHHLLDPDLTASWEKGLSYVSEGKVSREEYTEKIQAFIGRRVSAVLEGRTSGNLSARFARVRSAYQKNTKGAKSAATKGD